MPSLASSRAFLFGCFALAATLLPRVATAEGASVSTQPSTSENIVVGFVGGFVRHNNSHHGPVVLAHHIGNTLPDGTYVRVFENRHRRQAYSAILRLLDQDRDGKLSPQEKSRAHIILFGQSWGASAAVMLARDLRRQDIPVLLTVQVDSVAKLWQNDSIIPDNVSEAINFYQTHGLIHGRRQIVAANPEKTEILGNYLVDYRKHPVRCPQASWTDRLLTPSHMQSECDPRLWSQIEDMVRNRLETQDTATESGLASSMQTSR